MVMVCPDITIQLSGIYVLAANDMFEMRNKSYPKYSIHVSFFEIYTGKLFDLLNSRQALIAREVVTCSVVMTTRMHMDKYS